MRIVSEKITRVRALVLAVILLLVSLPACSQPTPVSVTLALSEPPLLNKPVEITLEFSLNQGYRRDAKDVPASIRLPQHIVLVSGDLEWRGDMVHNQVYTVRAVVKAVQPGYYRIDGGVGAPLTGEESLYVGVFENTATIYGNNAHPRVNFETPEPSGPLQVSDAPATLFSSKLSFSEHPALGKPVLVTLDFALRESYIGDAPNTTAGILFPADGFEVVSTDLKAREEYLSGFSAHDKPNARYLHLEWHGDVVQGKTYSIQATIKAIRTGYWTLSGGASVGQGDGGGDFAYIGVFEDRTEISDLPLPRPPDGVPLYDAEHPDEPPVIIPFDKHPQLPKPKAMPYEDSAHGGSALDFTHPLTIKGKLVGYISQNAPGSKHLDTVDPVPLVWGQVYVVSAGIRLGEGLTGRGTGGSYGTNDGEYSITVENPYPDGFQIVAIPASNMAEVWPHLEVPEETYAVNYTHDAVPTTQAEVDMGVANPSGVSEDHRAAWRMYETLTNDIYDRGGYYFLRYSPRGPQTTEVGQVIAYYPDDPAPLTPPNPPFYDAYVTHALFFDRDNQTRALDIVQHEYAHFVMHGLLYDWVAWSPIQPAEHYLKEASSPTLGWTEGWADFFSLLVQNDKFLDDPRGTPPTSEDLEEPTWGSPDWDDGDQVEGRVAGALWDIFDSLDDGYDTYDQGFDVMMS